ncbi:quinolinate synthase NadA [Flavobacterium sp. CS20]|jgi:quinolinate synthase|uniref:quinolinate synthase NadA n=1 Tax=Flavobacterium sp. CS20 TaxID=2775246 RepID=UPI001B3A0957|nr:quinolinate synthase NadA [Flavobacterium sp. CS20]QTY25890.1 quinolinate synthase NadA [Flavobacterium sp. CS20]
MNIPTEIQNLKSKKNAVILAHYYQNESIQDIADYIGDSLELAKKAQETSAEIIVFAGVHFMAETAKILNPQKKVLLPDLNAGCSLADSCLTKDFKKFIEAHPDHKVVTYINCSAEIKAMSDYVCTSSNAIDVIKSLPKQDKIIFAPDKNLGDYLIKETGRKMLLWNGTCVVHEAFCYDKILDLTIEYPDAQIIAHPESKTEILKIAHFIGSTSKLLKYVKEDSHKVFIVGTEAGILHQMQKEVPDKKLIPAPIQEDNTCACSECAFMKVNTLEKLYLCLKNETPEINLDATIAQKALTPLKKMLSYA